MNKLYDLLSDAAKETLKTPGSFVEFEFGWFFNRGGSVGVVTNLPAPTDGDFFGRGLIDASRITA